MTFSQKMSFVTCGASMAVAFLAGAVGDFWHMALFFASAAVCWYVGGSDKEIRIL